MSTRINLSKILGPGIGREKVTVNPLMPGSNKKVTHT